MNTHKMKLFFSAFIFLAVFPGTAAAYFTTDQSAVRLTDDTVMYTVTYGFGFEERGLYMPIIASRDYTPSGTALHAGYTILDDDDESVSVGVSNALILTNSSAVEVVDGTYYLEPGEAASFTLVALLTLPTTEELETSLLMTHLPFTMVIDGKDAPNKLNEPELRPYRTPSIEL